MSGPASRFIIGLTPRPRLWPPQRRARHPSIATKRVGVAAPEARPRLSIPDWSESRAQVAGHRTRTAAPTQRNPRRTPLLRKTSQWRSAPDQKRSGARSVIEKLVVEAKSRVRGDQSCDTQPNRQPPERERRADRPLGLRRTSPSGFVDPQRQNRPRRPRIVERRPQRRRAFSSRLRPCGGPLTITPIRS